jgi:hypothetical protein
VKVLFAKINVRSRLEAVVAANDLPAPDQSLESGIDGQLSGDDVAPVSTYLY